VWSAALASCAIPYVYAPVELMAKDASGHLVPYFSEGGVKFADGSINSDLPMRRLAELFNVNHFIVSQVNPHVIPFVVSDSNEAFSPISPTLKIIKFLNRQVKSILIGVCFSHRCSFYIPSLSDLIDFFSWPNSVFHSPRLFAI
jgi:TAG lipase/steryl ester hydrolase/phospholipase A2/LPA acyltransferase